MITNINWHGRSEQYRVELEKRDQQLEAAERIIYAFKHYVQDEGWIENIDALVDEYLGRYEIPDAFKKMEGK